MGKALHATPLHCLLLLLTATLCAPAFAQDLTVCAGKGYTLNSAADAVGASGGVTYTWYENGNPVENSNTASISFPNGKDTGGTYYYSRKASNAACSEGVFSNTYTVVVAGPTITVQPTSTSICSGGTVTLSVTASNATAYQWKDINNADVTSGTGGQSAAYTTAALTATTSFYVMVSNTLSACSTYSTVAIVKVNAVPDAPSASSPQAFCPGSTVADLSATGTDIKWYSGSEGGTALETTTALASGTYYASQTADGCESPRTDVTVMVLSASTPSLSRSSASTCTGAAITFTASGGSSYEWDCSSFTCSGNGEAQTTPTTAGNYSAQVRSVTASGSLTCYSGYTTAQTATIVAGAANGQAATACGCEDGTTNCSGTCKTNATNVQNNGGCTGSCGYAYTQLYNQCGQIINAQYGTYQLIGCFTGTPTHKTACTAHDSGSTPPNSPTEAAGMTACRQYCTGKGCYFRLTSMPPPTGGWRCSCCWK